MVDRISRRSLGGPPSAKPLARMGGPTPILQPGLPRPWTTLVRIFTLVELTGRWPSTWAANSVCLLPKGGTRSPRRSPPDRPLVGCLPAVGCRPGQAFSAMAPCAVASCPAAPAVRMSRPELLGVHTDVTASAGSWTAGLTVDWSKCYEPPSARRARGRRAGGEAARCPMATHASRLPAPAARPG